MVEPRTLSWRQKTWRRFSLGSCPAVAPQTTIRPPRAQATTDFSNVAAPTWSTTMSAPRRPVSFFTSATMSAVAWLMVSSAPSARAAASFASVDAVAITRAPQSLAIWIAAVPTPEPPAMTSTVSPCWIAARSTSICQAVMNTVGIAASWASSSGTRARGAGTRLAAGTTTYSACPPCVCSPSIL